MLEYNLDDAEGLLKKNLEAANKSLSQVEDDLGFLRDQTTTLEVSILCHNLMVYINNDLKHLYSRQSRELQTVPFMSRWFL